jgi:photosystem II stability/assembly factor-like uncharacterized protein
MKKWNGISAILWISILILSINGCTTFTDDMVIDEGVVEGRVTDLSSNPLIGVKVSLDQVVAFTDAEGYFKINNAKIGDKQVLFFTKDDYAGTQKRVHVKLNENTFVFAALGKWDKSTSIDPTVGNTVDFQSAKVTLPANGIVDLNGNPVSGNITVKTAYFDPTMDNYGDVFLGDFEGEDLSGNIVPLESFGFITVELSQGNKELDLASGQVSEITIPIPAALLSSAPQTIPLWYFDEEIGTWVEEGSASIQNGSYVGTVSHFTSWNCDAPINSSTIKGRVTCEDGTPIEGARVIAKGVDYSAFRRVETEADGSYEVQVKSNATVDVYAIILSPFGTVIGQSQTVRTSTASGTQTKTIEDLLIRCDTTTGNYSQLYDVVTDFPYSWDYGRAFAVGEGGWIVSYDWDQDIWVRQDAATTESFYGIECPAWNSMWAVGSNGIVRFSDNLGESWQPVFIGTDADLYDIEFYNAYYGWIVGSTGKIFSTTDAGLTWNPQTSGSVQTLYDGAFVSKNKGWVCGTSNGTFGTILHTVNGGLDWQEQVSSTPENLRAIEFITPDKGWAVGENGVIVRTLDGGQTWTPQASGTLEDLNGIDFANQRSGTIVGNNGVYLQTGDGGETWTKYTHQLSNNLEAVDFRSRHGWGYVVGDDNIFDLSAGNVEAYTQGWVLQSNEPEKLSDIEAVSVTEAWTVGNKGTVLRTTDAGNSWLPSNFNNTDDLYTIEVIGNNIWIGGDNNTLYKSEDQGLNWTAQVSHDPDIRIEKVQFIDESNGYYKAYDDNASIGNAYSLYKTGDGGQTWSKTTKPSNFISDFLFTDVNTGWACGSNEIHETVDGGASWQTTSLDFEGNQPNDGIIAAYNNDLLWFTTGSNFYHSEKGKDWYGKFIDFNEDYTLKSLTFTDAQTAFAVYDFIGGDIVKTINGGKTWYTQRAGNFEALDMVNASVGWAIGINGEIVYTTSGGD